MGLARFFLDIFEEVLQEGSKAINVVQVTGGRNGYGAKLANIFSTEFTIETCDGNRQRRYASAQP